MSNPVPLSRKQMICNPFEDTSTLFKCTKYLRDSESLILHYKLHMLHIDDLLFYECSHHYSVEITVKVFTGCWMMYNASLHCSRLILDLNTGRYPIPKHGSYLPGDVMQLVLELHLVSFQTSRIRLATHRYSTGLLLFKPIKEPHFCMIPVFDIWMTTGISLCTVWDSKCENRCWANVLWLTLAYQRKSHHRQWPDVQKILHWRLSENFSSPAISYFPLRLSFLCKQFCKSHF